MEKNKIDLVKLNELLRSGKSSKEAAQFFQCSEVGIWKAKKRLSSAVVKNLALESAHRVVEKNLDVVNQLAKINQNALEILDGLMSKVREGTPSEGIAIKAMQEIRNQLSFQVEILKTLYDLKSIAHFQETVLQSIAEVAPEVQRQIVKKLKEAKALRGSVEIR